MNSPAKKHLIVEIDIQCEQGFIVKKKINRFSNEESSNKINIYIELNKSRKIREKYAKQSNKISFIFVSEGSNKRSNK